MKNLLKLFAVVMAAAFLLGACSKQELEDIVKRGGTIEITNKTGNTNYYTVIEGEDLAKITEMLAALASGEKGELINKDATKKITYETVGIYTVVALFPAGFHDTVILALGETKKVTIK